MVSQHLLLAINTPISWTAESIGISAYVGLTDHQALRANVATHPHEDAQLGYVVGILFGGDGPDGEKLTGRTTDLGIAWEYFPRRTFDGLFVELGGLARFRNTDDT